MELQPETEIPGKCCGEYSCNFEPNCKEILDTEHYWLTDCKRCKCTGGKRECLVVCDEMASMIPHRSINNQINNNISNNTNDSDEDFGCFSKALNQFFLSGQKWKEDNNCTLCECFGQHAKCEDICHIPPSTTLTTNPEALNEKPCFSNRLNKKFSHGKKWEEDNCTLCQCHNGAYLCENNCENLSPSNCISNNRSFDNEETWTEDNGCSHCKCENGERHCQTSLCKQPNCKKQIKIPGECCSRCIDDNDNTTTTIIPVILIKPETETDNPLTDTNDNTTSSTPNVIIPRYDSPTNAIESVSIPSEPIESISESVTESTSEITSSITTNDINNDGVNESVSSVEKEPIPDHSYLLWIIFVLVFGLTLSIFGNFILCRKLSNNSRSYNPVSRTDDNFNTTFPSYKCSYENEKEKINQNGKENEK